MDCFAVRYTAIIQIIDGGDVSPGDVSPVPYIVTGACIDVLDRACRRVCPVDCIYEGGRMMYINVDECVDCGACEAACPTEAIYYEDNLPENLQVFADANRAFFDKLGKPGGARKVGKLTYDVGPASDTPKTAGP